MSINVYQSKRRKIPVDFSLQGRLKYFEVIIIIIIIMGTQILGPRSTGQ